MSDNPFKQNCPHCRRENPADARFCTVCGGTLQVETESYGATLFFSTPAFLLLFGLGISFDVGGTGLSDWGFSLGLALITLYFFSCGALYFPARLLGKTISLIKTWEAGVFGICQFGLVYLLQIPLVEWFSREFSTLSLTQEAQLKESLLLVSFLPLLAAGVFLLIRRLPDASGALSAPLPAWISPPLLLLVTVVATLVLYLGLPGFQKQYLWGRIWSQYGALPTAESYLDKALALKPDYPAALHLKGLIQISRRNDNPTLLKDGIITLKTAQELEPRNPRFLLSLSLAHDFSREASESIRYASQAVSLAPDDPFLWTNLADALQRHKRSQDAVYAYRRALSLTPSDPRLLNNLAFTLLELGQDREVALDLARESVRLLPDTAFNLDTLAWAYHKNGMNAEALETIREARKLASGSAEIDFHFGVIAMACGVLAKPIAFFTELGSRPDIALEPELQHRLVEVLASLTGIITAPVVDNSSTTANVPASQAVTVPPSPGTALPEVRSASTATDVASPPGDGMSGTPASEPVREGNTP